MYRFTYRYLDRCRGPLQRTFRGTPEAFQIELDTLADLHGALEGLALIAMEEIDA